jgi:uncharacterized membrane protein YfhO
MPRAFVPRRVQVIADAKVRLNAMTRAEFDPSDLAYVEHSIALPHDSAGTVEIVQEAYHHLTLRAQMQTSGLVVLADRWDAGWRAYVNDLEVPILRVNHAVRGVLAGPGTSTIRFVYLPAGFYLGLAITAAGVLCLLTWASIIVARGRRASKTRN